MVLNGGGTRVVAYLRKVVKYLFLKLKWWRLENFSKIFYYVPELLLMSVPIYYIGNIGIHDILKLHPF